MKKDVCVNDLDAFVFEERNESGLVVRHEIDDVYEVCKQNATPRCIYTTGDDVAWKEFSGAIGPLDNWFLMRHDLVLGNDSYQNREKLLNAINNLPKWPDSVNRGVLHILNIVAEINSPLPEITIELDRCNVMLNIFEGSLKVDGMLQIKTFASDDVESSEVFIKGEINLKFRSTTTTKKQSFFGSVFFISYGKGSVYRKLNNLLWTHDFILNITVEKNLRDNYYRFPNFALFSGLDGFEMHNAKISVNFYNPDHCADVLNFVPFSFLGAKAVFKDSSLKINSSEVSIKSLSSIFSGIYTWDNSVLYLELGYLKTNMELSTSQSARIRDFKFSSITIKSDYENNKVIRVRRKDHVRYAKKDKSVNFALGLMINKNNLGYFDFVALIENTTNEYMPVKMKNIQCI